MHAQVLARTDAPLATISRWAKRAGMSELTMEPIKDYIEEMERTLFDTEGRSGGRPWAPDAPATRQERSRAGTGDKVLDASGDLKRSLTESGDENAIREYGPGYMKLGSKLPYAEILKKGWSTSEQRVPARPPIQFASRDRYAILKIFKAGISGKTNIAVRPSLKSIRL